MKADSLFTNFKPEDAEAAEDHNEEPEEEFEAGAPVMQGGDEEHHDWMEMEEVQGPRRSRRDLSAANRGIDDSKHKEEMPLPR